MATQVPSATVFLTYNNNPAAQYNFVAQHNFEVYCNFDVKKEVLFRPIKRKYLS